MIVVVTLIACSESTTTTDTPASQNPDSQAAGQNSANDPPPSANGESEAELEIDPQDQADRGRAVYTANCVACHNPDPSLDGGIGPAVAGSSLDLLEARIMHNAYPDGYKPKRETKAMIPLPYLEKDLPALAVFLAL